MSTQPFPERVSIVIAAPNPTGNLHLGHALNLTIEDVLARWYRLHGTQVDWEGATDHGASSTEIVMHRALLEQGQTLARVSDESKLELLSAITQRNVSAIAKQFQDLRLTLDGADMRSFEDPDVEREFHSDIRALLDRGYLYASIKTDDWCYERGQSVPAVDSVPDSCDTTIHSLRYSADDSYITIDHSELAYLIDEIGILVPYASGLARFGGGFATNPLGKRVRIHLADVPAPCSLIPAYDEASLKFCRAHELEFPCSIDHYGVLRASAFENQDFRAVSDQLLEVIQGRKALRESRNTKTVIRRCRGTGLRTYRRAVSGIFVRTSALIRSAIDAVASGRVSISPKRFGPWLIVRMKETLSQGAGADWRLTREHLCGTSVPQDVIAALEASRDAHTRPEYRMDMMISCALWTYAANSKYRTRTHGAPRTKRTSIVTGVDLVSWWIGTAIALSDGIGKPIPFSDVIIHPLIVDKSGKKMSKSMRNTVELDTVIRQFGADALRLYVLSRWVEKTDFVNIDLDELARIDALLRPSSRDSTIRTFQGGSRLSAEDVNEDLSGIERLLAARDFGTAARIVLKWLASPTRWESLPDSVVHPVQQMIEVFLGQPIALRTRADSAYECAVDQAVRRFSESIIAK